MTKQPDKKEAPPMGASSLHNHSIEEVQTNQRAERAALKTRKPWVHNPDLRRTPLERRDMSIKTGTYFDKAIPANRDMARQDQAADADINNILRRFGATAEQRQLAFGVFDDSIDLQTAMNSTAEAKAAYLRLAPELRDNFPTFASFLTGMETGHVATKLEELGKKHATMHEDSELGRKLTREDQLVQMRRNREADAIAQAHREGKPPVNRETPSSKEDKKT